MIRGGFRLNFLGLGQVSDAKLDDMVWVGPDLAELGAAGWVGLIRKVFRLFSGFMPNYLAQ